MDVPDERLLAVVDHLHGPLGAQREHRGVDLHGQVLTPTERAAHSSEVDAHLLGREVEAGRDLVAIDVQPLRRDVDVDPALAVRDRDARLGPEEGLILLPDLVEAGDGDVAGELGIAASDDHRTHHVRPRVVAVAVARRRPVGVQRLHLGRALGVDHRLERLVLDANGCRRAARLLRLLGRDDRDGLAEVANPVARENGLIRELEPVGLLPRHVLVREHGVDSRKRAGRRDVDLEDARVRVWAPHGLAPEHPRGLQVAGVRELAGDLRNGVGAARAASPRAPEGGSAWSCSSGRRLVDGVEDLLVPGAAAEVARQRLADLVVARIRDAAQEVGRGDDEAGRAEPALDRARIGERLLHGMEVAVLGEPFDGDDLVALRLRREDETRAHELSVEENRARSALALLARVLRPRQCRADRGGR